MSKNNKKNKYNILLFVQATYKNRGCEAIVTTISKNIKEINKHNEVTVATFDLENDIKYHKDLVNKYVQHSFELQAEDLKKVKRDNIENIQTLLQKEVLNEVPAMDICLSIGGDNYCYGGHLNFLYTIDDVVKNENKKLILYGASIDENIVTPEFIQDIRKFDVILVRESLTHALLSRFIDVNRLIVGPDTAFSLDAKEVILPNVFLNKEDVIGLNLSPLILDYQGKDTDIVVVIKSLIDHILNRYQYNIALIPHVYTDGNSDLDILKEIYTPYQNNSRVAFLNNREYSCNELKYIISKCRFLVAARTHASIAGYSSLVPTLVLGYSTKSKGIARDIFGSYEDYVVPVQDVVTSEKLINKFENILANEKSIKAILSDKMPRYIEESKTLFQKVLKKIIVLDEEYIASRETCSGCSACVNVCPKDAIKMKPNREGFLFPVIDFKKCIHCNLCRKTCPINKNYSYKYSKNIVNACENLDIEERLKSSSGGVFSLFAKCILQTGGCVFGAATDGYKVNHVMIRDVKDLDKLKGSKYVQSFIGNTYKEAKEILESNRRVLFSGTPCQIEGLKSFLGKNYKNLICVSVICHGVPSEMVFANHLKELEAEYEVHLTGINFRNKENGWRNYQSEYLFKGGSIKKSILDDPYMQGFLKNYFLRPSCYNCKFKLFQKNTSDIILGDLWGADNILKIKDDDMGTSVVIINSEKGQQMLEEINSLVSIEEVDLKQVCKYNPSLFKSSNLGIRRFDFFDVFNKFGTKFAVKYCLDLDELERLRVEAKNNEINIRRLLEQTKQLDEKEHTLQVIVNSRSWKILEKLRAIVRKNVR